MLVILLHSLCTCQEQSQNVGTFLSKKSWLRVRAKKWQICVGSRLHILCYSGSIRVWASPYRLVHSEVTLTKNALKKCPCQICHKIYIFYDAKQNTKYAKKPQLCQKNTKYAKKAPNTPKYSKFSFTLFCREKILFQIYALCWCTFYRPKKYGGVPKWTNIRYANRQGGRGHGSFFFILIAKETPVQICHFTQNV